MPKDKRPPKPAPKPASFSPGTFSAKPSPEQVKQLYMASPHIEWAPFARSNNWNPTDSRSGLPVNDWVKQKRDTLAQEQAENIAEAVFNHRGKWHQDVLHTLKEYPAASDTMLGLLKVRMNEMISAANHDRVARQQAEAAGRPFKGGEFHKYKTSELASLASAIKTCTEAKHRALLIDTWSFKVAEGFSDPAQFATEQEKVANMEFKVKLIGHEEISSSDLQQLLNSYYDQPTAPHSDETIEAEARQA